MYWIGLFCELFQTAIQVAQIANLHIANQWEEKNIIEISSYKLALLH